MHKKPILILIAVVVAIFLNTLGNGFVGDDNFLILGNDFYTSLSNMKDLFTDKYLTSSNDALSVQDQSRYFSGSVAYRPVLSFTYFIDYALWQLNPIGYHLTNGLWHLGNCLLVYAFIFIISKMVPIAFLSSLIFAVHPFKSEAVSSIGYRADLISTFFLLFGLITYILFRQKGKDGKYLFVSMASFFLAIFSKESVIVYPMLLLVYDVCIGQRANPFKISSLFDRSYWGFYFISLIYLFVYLFVFPNAQASVPSLFGGSILSHVVVCCRILGEYLMGFFFPFVVKVLPPVYMPKVYILFGLKTWLSLIFIVLSGAIFCKLYVRDKSSRFFVLWFWICLIPVSNLIPLVNPMAHRFMYLPSIGISFVVATILIELGQWINTKAKANHFVYILSIAYLAVCGIMTIQINAMWKHDFIMAYRLYENHPDDKMSHLFMAITYERIGELEKANDVIIQGMQLGLEDPRVYYVLGQTNLENLELSEKYFKQGVLAYPDYAPIHLGMGRVYLLQGDRDKALFHVKKSIELTPSYKGYCYLTQIYLIEGDFDMANEILRTVKATLPDVKYHEFLENIINHRDEIKLPQDIGF